MCQALLINKTPQELVENVLQDWIGAGWELWKVFLLITVVNSAMKRFVKCQAYSISRFPPLLEKVHGIMVYVKETIKCRREPVPFSCNAEEQQNHATQSPLSSIVEDPQNHATETPVTKTIGEPDQQNNVVLEHLPEQGESSVQLQQQGPLKGDDVIQYKVGEWTHANVLSRAGKAKTATRHWYNVQDI